MDIYGWLGESLLSSKNYPSPANWTDGKREREREGERAQNAVGERQEKREKAFRFDVFVVVVKSPKSCIKWIRADRQKTQQMCSGAQSCYSYFMRVSKINTPINTLQAPSNLLQPCMKEALFFNPLLRIWVAPKWSYRLHLLKNQVCKCMCCSGAAPTHWHHARVSTHQYCGHCAA